MQLIVMVVDGAVLVLVKRDCLFVVINTGTIQSYLCVGITMRASAFPQIIQGSHMTLWGRFVLQSYLYESYLSLKYLYC